MNALLPMIGIVIGAALQFWLSRVAEKGKHVDTLRAEAYADYLRALAASGHLRPDDDCAEAFRSAADAKTRILVYGTVEVIAALARFEETGASLGQERSIAAFVTLVAAMRSSDAAIPERDIRLVLFGPARVAPADRSGQRSG